MRFTQALALGSTLAAVAAGVPTDAATAKRAEQAPAAPSTNATLMHPVAWPREKLREHVANSRPDPSQRHPPANDTMTTMAWPCGDPAMRPHWHSLSDQQRDDYVGAVRCLMNRPSGDPNRFPGSRNRYEDFASWHQQQTNDVHNGGTFLPWHRYFLAVFESVLRDECGYGGPMIWWDEALDAGNFRGSSVFNPRWFGRLPDSPGDCVGQTGFGDYEPNLGPNWDINNPHCLWRSADEGASYNTNPVATWECMSAQNYDAYRSCSEYGVHAYGHIGVGGIMNNVPPSPEDPIFMLHHAFIDRNWRTWENYDWQTRIYEVGGPRPGGGTTSPSDVLTSFGIRPDVTIADVLDTQAAYLCYRYDKEN